MNLFRLSTLALAIVLAACGSDGKDGQDGQNGSNGSDGTNAPTAKALDLTILHMNDHHSHLSAETLDIDTSALALNAKTEADEAISEVAVEYGGFPMLTTLFTTLSNQHTNVLKLHSGDAVTGTLYFSLFNGTADAAVMNQICFDAFALGNHEFDGGDSGLANFLDSLNASACETATLAANVQPSATSAIASGYIQPYTIVEKDGEKIGIIGIDIASKTQNSSFPDAGTLLLDETETAQQYIDELTAAGINKIILMTHYQYANDLTLASNLTGVDVIVGGDSHTLLGDSTFTKLGFNPVAAYPTVVTNKDGDTTCVVHAWEYAHLLGKLDVSFDADGVVTQCSGHPYLPIGTTFTYAYNGSEDRTLDAVDAFTVTQQLTADDDVVSTIADSNSAAILAGYDQVADVLRQTVIGTISEDLCLERIPGQGRSSICDVSDTTVHGSDISNIVAKAFMTITPTADIAIQNGGGVRVDVASGDYTIADAYSLLPFANTMATLEMTGQQIKNVLEDAFDYALSDGGSTGSYPYASGLRFDVDASQAKGSRFSNLEVNSRVAGDWGAIDLAATYIVVTNNYIAAGQDGYTTFAEITGDAYVDTFTEYAQGFMDYVKQLSDAGQTVNKLPISEYSTQSYIGTDSCNHSSGSCIGF
ncbi:5'-nucleotidase C-terminal domain-containing protein [Oceanobacter antarcticus]|uniref:5'-nucleotidase C-terminal domain-containing protein n=1 Tax=Oceanobacter antarcticus TaxID=3133425 RepID=A0ABW8NNW6_9GAMM